MLKQYSEGSGFFSVMVHKAHLNYEEVSNIYFLCLMFNILTTVVDLQKKFLSNKKEHAHIHNNFMLTL